jgi:predicted phage terminase large subunit-like protein
MPPVVTSTPEGIHTHALVDIPERFDQVVESWDLAFKGTAGTDRVAGGKWGRWKNDKYLLSVKYGNMDFIQTCAAVAALHEETPRASHVLVEEKANGAAVIATLKKKINGLIPVQATTSKTSRALDASKAMSVQAQHEAGQIFLPHPSIAPWVDILIEEFSTFPLGKHDDLVDMTVYAIQRLSRQSPAIYTQRDLARDISLTSMDDLQTSLKDAA